MSIDDTDNIDPAILAGHSLPNINPDLADSDKSAKKNKVSPDEYIKELEVDESEEEEPVEEIIF